MLSAAISITREKVTGRGLAMLPAFALPLGLLLIALLAAAVPAYGTRPWLGKYDWGIDAIIFVRRMQWLAVTVSLLACLGVLISVIANKATVWWLIGLAPVLALFVVRFAPRYAEPAGVLEAPVFVEPAHPRAPRGEEWVVGLIFEDEAYAFPYRALYATPIVTVTDYNKRMLLLWSACANRALAVNITRDLRPRALEIVSTPGDGLLIFDHRYGQFISSVTGRTIGGAEPIGFAAPIRVTKTTWDIWRAMQPGTRVMLPAGRAASSAARPLAPGAALPGRASIDAPAQTLVAVMETSPPVALRCETSSNEPMNLIVGQTRVLVVRDPRTGTIRAFERRVSQDLFPTFTRRTDVRKHPEAILVDSDTMSAWTPSGRAVAGPAKGERLREIPIEDGLWWGVMKYWYPDLQLIP